MLDASAETQVSAPSLASSPLVLNESAMSAAPVAPQPKKSKRFGADLTNTISTSVVNAGANERSTTNDVELAPWVQLNKILKLDLYVAVSKDLERERKLTLQNTMLGLSHRPVSIIGDELKYRLKVSAILPTNEKDREMASLRGGVSLGNRFLISPKVLPAFSSYYQLSLGKSFHGYDTTVSGQSNNQFSVGHTLLMNVDISQFYVQVVPRITSKFTYEGTPSSSFELAEEIGMNIGKFSIGLGHTNSDNLVKANGRDSNFSVFDRDTSNYYMLANMSF